MSKSVAYPDNNPKSIIGITKPGFHAIPPVALMVMAQALGGSYDSFMSIPPVALLHLGMGMEDGRRKYGIVNWRSNSVAASVYYNAALRHGFGFRDGENYAADSHVHHLGHFLSCGGIILDAMSGGNLIDDRGHPGTFASRSYGMIEEPTVGFCTGVAPHYDAMLKYWMAWWDGLNEVKQVNGTGVHPIGYAMAHAARILEGLEANTIVDDRLHAAATPGPFPKTAARLTLEIKARAQEPAEARTQPAN